VKVLRKWLSELEGEGKKSVSLSALNAKLDEIEAKEKNGKAKLPRLMGTAEAAEYLGVERTRIGKWLNMGVMPEPAVKLKGTPVWTFDQVRGMKGERAKRTRKKKVTTEA
jgi:hypothetical protein